jgi:cob(I)alamin adenosyltransferase
MRCVPGRKKRLLDLAGSGDDGSTRLLGGGRTPKDDLRIEAYGTVDEASSALGLAKGLASDAGVREVLEQLQRGLYRLGAEMATSPDREGAFGRTSAKEVEELERLMSDLEAEAEMPDGFVLPGMTAASGALDLARATVRRAERRWVALQRRDGGNPEIGTYLNRLSLLLFVLARVEERRAGASAKPARS